MKSSFTKNRCRTASLLLLLIAGLSLGGCKLAHMALPQGIQGSSSAHAVEGLRLSFIKKSFNFGSYRIADISREWTRGKGWWISKGDTKFRDSEAKQKYEFTVVESDRTVWGVKCATEADWGKFETKGLFGGGFGIEQTSNKQLICAMKREGREKLSWLVMKQTKNELKMEGTVTDGAIEIDISVTHKLDTTFLKMGDPTGYIFRIKGRPVGAVEIINSGTVWLDDSVKPETRSTLAATSAVLLLYQDVKKQLQRTRRM